MDNETENATIAEIKQAGFDRGYGIATWNDPPAIGEETDPCIDWIGIGVIESLDDQCEYLECLCAEAESNNRQYSPFEFTAHEFNEREDSAEVWDAFDEGIAEGIAKRVEEFRKANQE